MLGTHLAGGGTFSGYFRAKVQQYVMVCLRMGKRLSRMKFRPVPINMAIDSES
jgi:hypothetical protein